MKMFTHTGWHENASAGNRTRVNCLEGSYAHHYTTDALQYTEVTTKSIFFVLKERGELNQIEETTVSVRGRTGDLLRVRQI